MKKYISNLLVFITLIIFSGMVFTHANAQQVSGQKYIFEKKGDRLIGTDEDGNRTLDFVITGLTSKDQADKIVSQYKAYRGVSDFTLTPAADGKYLAHGVFGTGSNAAFFKEMFKSFGIASVQLNGTDIPVDQFGAKKRTR
jgi:hypothetical protein